MLAHPHSKREIPSYVRQHTERAAAGMDNTATVLMSGGPLELP
jgi:hypothetical protein